MWGRFLLTLVGSLFLLVIFLSVLFFVLNPNTETNAKNLCRKWGLEFGGIDYANFNKSVVNVSCFKVFKTNGKKETKICEFELRKVGLFSKIKFKIKEGKNCLHLRNQLLNSFLKKWNKGEWN